MRTHPPIFTRLARENAPYGAVNVLARRIAHRETSGELGERIQRALDRHRMPNFPNYQPDERDCS